MNPSRLLKRIAVSQTNVRFRDLVRLAEALGFVLERSKGSHFLYVHSKTNEMLNLQNDGGQAKPYQVRQLLRIVEVRTLRIDEHE